MNLPTNVLDARPLGAIGRLGLGALSLILANASALIFVLVYDVTAFQLVLIFWCECVWIGVFSAIMLLTASVIGHPFENRVVEVTRGAAVFSSLLVIGFASSAFFALLGLVLAAILAANEALALSSQSDEVLDHIGLVIGASAILLAGHAASFVVNFLMLGEFRNVRVGTLVAQPFMRSGALLLAILVSIGLVAIVPRFASTAAFGLLVIGVKVTLDLKLYLAERRTFA